MNRLSEIVRARRGSLSLRAAASEIGINYSNLLRVERGGLPNLSTFSLLCAWTGKDANELLDAALRAKGEG